MAGDEAWDNTAVEGHRPSIRTASPVAGAKHPESRTRMERRGADVVGRLRRIGALPQSRRSIAGSGIWAEEETRASSSSRQFVGSDPVRDATSS
jgi:hypothetical protein